MTKKDEKSIILTIGSKYVLRSMGSRDEMIESRGTFKGIVSVGTVDGLAIELEAEDGEEEGRIRVIPSHMVLALDIVEAVAKEEAKKEDPHMHYS